MIKQLVILLLATIVTACNNNQGNTSSADSASTLSGNNFSPKQETELCFERTENQDTSTIHLIFELDRVSGSFNHIPYEKDSRKGTLSGTRNGDTIKAVWKFMQEGMNDTLSVEFKLSENELYQKTFGIDQQTGRQKLTDTSTFSIRYEKVACSK